MYKDEVMKSNDLISPVICRTPLIKSNYLSKNYNSNIYYKCENLQTIGAFKIRGSANKVLNYIKENKNIETLYAASSGNHACGVAKMAQYLNINAQIYVSNQTPNFKKEKIKSYGAKLVEHGESFDQAYMESVKRQKEDLNSMFVHPFDDHDVLVGNGTIGYEILEQLHDVDNIIVPIGGGGLISGISKYIKEVNKNIKIIGVEPINNPSMKNSVTEGCVKTQAFKKTIADGVNVLSVAKNNLEIVSNLVDEIVLVSEMEIQNEIKNILIKDKLLTEGAGALSVAALKKIKIKKNEKYVCLLSGGNMDPQLLIDLLK